MDKLRTFFEKYIPLCDTSYLINAFNVSKRLKKRDFLIKPGQNCAFLAFVDTGIFRVFFYNAEGIEVTVWFSFEGMMVGDLLAFYKDSKATFYVQAIEDSEIKIIKKVRLKSYLYPIPIIWSLGENMQNMYPSM